MAANLERRGMTTGWGLPAVLRFATLAVAAGAVVVVVLVAVGPPVRPPGGAAPTSPGSPAAICEAFADGGPMETLGNAIFAARRGDDWTSPARDGITGLLALAERVSGYEREDLLVLARAVDDFTTAWGEATKYSPDEFQDLPQDAQDALQNAAQDAWDALQDAQPAFYLQYTERCGVALDAPRTVDCGPLDPLACDRAVAGLIAGQRQRWEEGFYDEGLPPGLPVLYVGFGGASGCISHSEIMWPGGGMVAEIMC